MKVKALLERTHYHHRCLIMVNIQTWFQKFELTGPTTGALKLLYKVVSDALYCIGFNTVEISTQHHFFQSMCSAVVGLMSPLKINSHKCDSSCSIRGFRFYVCIEFF